MKRFILGLFIVFALGVSSTGYANADDLVPTYEVGLSTDVDVGVVETQDIYVSQISFDFSANYEIAKCFYMPAEKQTAVIHYNNFKPNDFIDINNRQYYSSDQKNKSLEKRNVKNVYRSPRDGLTYLSSC